jgi:Domain of unknown function (DUF4402)
MRLASIIIVLLTANMHAADALAQTTPQPLLAVPFAQLKFPPVATAGSGNGSVTINPVTGAVSKTGAVHVFTGTGNPALLQIVGVPGRLVSVRVPTSVQLVAGSGQIISLQNLVSTGQGGLRLNATGLAQARIGGTLPITPASTAGAYRGRATIAVDYVFE